LFSGQGKVFLAIEATSQLYRAAVPFQSWLYYLVNSYEGVYRVLGFTLAAAYIVCKFWEMLERFKVWHKAVSQLFNHSVSTFFIMLKMRIVRNLGGGYDLKRK
jgi:hypothetical protein